LFCLGVKLGASYYGGEHRMKKILGPKKNDVAVEWRRVHDEEL